jgi:uncharacterized membrane protein
MIPFYVLVVSVGLARAAGAIGVPALDAWSAATRAGLAVMFGFTAVAHFGRERGDLMRMVPPVFGRAGPWVTLTGVAELAGALGLLVPATRQAAALGLIVLLVAMFPANVRAAREGLTIGGRPHTPLPLRAVLQLL